MAAVSATARTHHGTLVANTTDTVTFPFDYRWVTVRNRATTGVLYVRADGAAATVGGAGTTAVPAGQSVLVPNEQPVREVAISVNTVLVVSIISATADPYSLEG